MRLLLSVIEAFFLFFKKSYHPYAEPVFDYIFLSLNFIHTVSYVWMRAINFCYTMLQKVKPLLSGKTWTTISCY